MPVDMAPLASSSFCCIMALMSQSIAETASRERITPQCTDIRKR